MNTPKLTAEIPAIPDPRNTNGLHDEVSDCLARLQTLLDLLQSTTGISANEATTVVYWAISTYGLPHLQKFPMLVVYGPGGTGKTTLLEILQKLCYEPSGGLINGKSTEPVLRDELKLNTTALIDEADSIHEPWMIARHSRQSSTINLNRPAQGGGWHRTAWNLFGATALHRRRPFKDPAVHSRAITDYQA